MPAVDFVFSRRRSRIAEYVHCSFRLFHFRTGLRPLLRTRQTSCTHARIFLLGKMARETRFFCTANACLQFCMLSEAAYWAGVPRGNSPRSQIPHLSLLFYIAVIDPFCKLVVYPSLYFEPSARQQQSNGIKQEIAA